MNDFFTSAKLMYSFGGYEGSEQPDIYGKSEEENIARIAKLPDTAVSSRNSKSAKSMEK